VPGERPIFVVERDGAFEMGDGFGGFAALRVCDGEHVERVVVVRVFVAHQAEMGDCLVVAAAVDRERGCVEPFVDRLRRFLAGTRLPPANVEVEPDALVQFFLVGILAQDRLEQVGRPPVIVALEGFEAAFVQCDGVDLGRTTLRR
jgi:hypothetical protein